MHSCPGVVLPWPVGIDVFFDSGQYITGTTPAGSVDGGLLVAYVSPLNRVLGENRETLTFGIRSSDLSMSLSLAASGPGCSRGVRAQTTCGWSRCHRREDHNPRRTGPAAARHADGGDIRPLFEFFGVA
jgi:hypothetical protein